MILKETYVELLEQGISLEVGQLSISPMRRFGKTVYQVHCDDYRRQFSHIHKDILDAIDEFLETKNEFYKRSN